MPALTRAILKSHPSPIIPIEIAVGWRSHTIFRDHWEGKRDSDG
jgi:hypothetical protein